MNKGLRASGRASGVGRRHCVLRRVLRGAFLIPPRNLPSAMAKRAPPMRFPEQWVPPPPAVVPPAVPVATRVGSIWIASTSAGTMRELPEAELVAGRGIKGDRYFLDQGTYSFIAEAGRQLTMISAEGAQVALAAKGIKVEPLGKLRRNVHLLGISCSELLDLRGLLVEIGSECRVFVHRNNVPCAYNEAKNGGGLME